MRAFVIRPLGREKDAPGDETDFDRVEAELIGPALARAASTGATMSDRVPPAPRRRARAALQRFFPSAPSSLSNSVNDSRMVSAAPTKKSRVRVSKSSEGLW